MKNNSISEVPSEISSPSHSISLSSDSGIQSPTAKKERKPKRVLYCSDGVYEEYSSDEEGVYSMSSEPPVDPVRYHYMFFQKCSLFNCVDLYRKAWLGHLG